MSLMNDLADEVLKPVKTGLYIGGAVVTIGSLAMLANSKMGRKFFTGVKDAMTGDEVPANTTGKTKKIEKPVTKEPTEIEDDGAVNMTDEEEEVVPEKKAIKGSNNV